MVQINLIQLAGLCACAPPAVLAVLSGSMIRRDRPGWLVLTLVWSLCFVEVLMGLRHQVHLLVVTDAIRLGFYGERRLPQEIVILALIAIGFAAGLLVMRRARRNGAPFAAATAAAIAIVLLFTIETISLHQLDGLLYGRAGPMMLIGWLWLGIGSCGSLAAMAAIGRR